MVKKFGEKTIDIHTEPRRVERGFRKGWYSLPTGDGRDEQYRRATTLAGAAEYTGNLERRSMRYLASGLSHARDLVARAALLGPDDREMDGIVYDALARTTIDESANMGTAFHDIVERIIMGQKPEIPEEWESFVTDYFEAIREAGFEIVPELCERTVLNPYLGVAGRFDNVLRRLSDGRLFMGDNKTGKDPFKYGVAKMVVQLYTYVSSPLMWDPISDTMVEKPEVDTDTAIIIHIPLAEGGPVTVNPLPLTDGPELAETCKRVLEFRSFKVKQKPFPRRATGFLARVAAAETKADLRGIRSDAQAAGEWTNELKDAVMERLLNING